MKRNKKILERKEKGITLIALVITIIVLLILAGVSIAMLIGENGILSQAQKAKGETESAQKEEENILTNYESVLNSYSGENTEFTDSLGNKVKVPAGFKIVNPEDNVEDGIVIEDVTHGATEGSQFVWIPVGTEIKKSDGTTFSITLGRYSFDTNGEVNVYNGSYKEDKKDEHTYKNTPAKDIEDFKSKVNKTGGYYLARYEARTKTSRDSVDDELTTLTVKQNDYVYNYVTQDQAARLSANMYNESEFESDLVNSYAWDTAVIFLQTCDNRTTDIKKPYSQQNSLNTGKLAIYGTNNLETKDQICNVFDMASNCREWTTETSNNSTNPCIYRGGYFDHNTDFTVDRSASSISGNNKNLSFRPILYL